MRVAYINSVSGASGDMLLGALVDAGLPLKDLTRELRKLPVAGFRLTQRSVQRGGVTATKVDVLLDESAEQPHRHLSDIEELIHRSALAASVKDKAIAVFRRLAEAEATVHRTSVEELHFHEVGALDAIVDVVGTVAGLDLLGVERLYCSPLPSGAGVITSEHGHIPSPAPGTLELLRAAKAPVRATTDPAELVTPTGAAIITTLATFGTPTLAIERIGYGAGSRDLPTRPNVLCLWVGQSQDSLMERDMLLLETNIDDMNPEMYGFVQERLFSLGARDVWFTPIQMKKARPATTLSALVAADLEEAAVRLLLRETTTLGIRIHHVRRREVERKVVTFRSSLGRVQVKVKYLDGKPAGLAPEHASCLRLALKRDLPLQEVYRIVSAEAAERLLAT
ncbi:MAG: nickel pincer cofactor biosynthesis protein LarC [Chloroflexi bacterium]|nr:nickel pincer cofactor biosynthesis protein LarC [Chloroflexota bacterium]